MAPATAPTATELLPTTNADSMPVVPMSDEQKYLFDLKGWITLPGLLDAAQLERIRAHQMQFLYQPETLPPEQRDNHGGPSQVLVDAPAVVGVLNEIISHQPLAAEDCYGFRFDHTHTSHRRGTTTSTPTAAAACSTSAATRTSTRCIRGGSTLAWYGWCGS